MSTAVETAIEIRSFRVDVPEDELLPQEAPAAFADAVLEVGGNRT